MNAQSADRGINIFQQFVDNSSPFDADKLADRLKHRNTEWSIPEAFLGVLVSAAMADGALDPSEGRLIQTLVGRSRAMKASNQDLGKLNDKVNRLLQSPDGLRHACETLPADMTLPVFAHCVDIVLSDGQLLKVEADYLDNLRKMLDIDEAHAKRVMEVLLLKAQY